LSKIKSTIKSLLLATFPNVVKNRIFKEQAKFSWETLNEINNEPEVLVVEEILAKHVDFIFLDVGCNKGEYTYAASKFLEPYNIYSFEPNLKLNYILEKIFSEVNVLPYALSNEETKAKFKVPSLNGHEDDSLGSLNTEAKETNETSADIFEVQCKRLDDVVAHYKIKRVDFIKIDVEGFELAVLEGAQHTIDEHSPLLLIEIEKKHNQPHTVLEIINSINNKHQHKYKVFFFNINTYHLTEVTSEPSQNQEDWGTRKYVNNFLFIPIKNVILNEIQDLNTKLDRIFASKKK
jgi:FkbM family methyltransferase